MAELLPADGQSDKIRPLLPTDKPRRCRHPGRRPNYHRQARTGIPFVLKTGIPSEFPRAKWSAAAA